MNLNGYRREQPVHGPIKLSVTGRLADKLRALHAESQIGCDPGVWRNSIEQYIIEILDIFVVEHRSCKAKLDPDRHWERNGDDASHVIV